MEKIDLLRELMDQHDRDHVSFDTFDGYMQIPDPDTHGASMKDVRTGDRAVVLLGPADQLDGVLRIDREKETATIEFTFPVKIPA
jgi:hypothetical protein